MLVDPLCLLPVRTLLAGGGRRQRPNQLDAGRAFSVGIGNAHSIGGGCQPRLPMNLFIASAVRGSTSSAETT